MDPDRFLLARYGESDLDPDARRERDTTADRPGPVRQDLGDLNHGGRHDLESMGPLASAAPGRPR